MAAAPSAKTSGHPLTIVSWNILADCYVRVKDQPWNAFSHIPAEKSDPECLLNWETRQQAIARSIANAKAGPCSGADVVALQEVVFEKIDGTWQLPLWLQTAAAAGGFTAVMQNLKQKEIESNAQRNLRMVGVADSPTGLSTLFRKDRFELHPGPPGSGEMHGGGSGSVLFLKGIKDAETEFRFLLANTHLVGDPEKADGQLLQLQSISKNMDKMLAKAGVGSPVARFIVGDFNNSCEADSAVMKWLTATAGMREAATPASWAEPGKSLRLDHIFFSGGEGGVPLRKTLTAEEMQRALADVAAAEGAGEVLDIAETGLPSKLVPSDHMPIRVEVDVCPQLLVASGIRDGEALPSSSTEAQQGGGSALSLEEKRAIVARIDEAQASAPGKVEGKPTPKQIEAAKAFAQTLKEICEGVGGEGSAARKFCTDYAKALKKDKGSVFLAGEGL